MPQAGLHPKTIAEARHVNRHGRTIRVDVIDGVVLTYVPKDEPRWLSRIRYALDHEGSTTDALKVRDWGDGAIIECLPGAAVTPPFGLEMVA